MKKYLLKVLAFGTGIIILVILLMIITSEIVKKRHFENGSTTSNTLVFGKNEHYDIMFSGTSHARMFSWRTNHKLVESILNKKVINIGQGGAICGPNEQLFYLKYFYKQNNNVDILVYFLSTPMLYSEILPVASNTFNLEPFNFKFFIQYLKFKAENKGVRLLDYCRSKLSLRWINLRPQTSHDPILDSTADPDTTGLRSFIATYYNPKDTARFNKSCKIVEKEIQFAMQHNIKIIFILSPTLFGHWPGHDHTIRFTEEMKKKYGIPYYDFTESMMDPQYFYDHQHLNRKGIQYFTKNYLKPVLDSIYSK